MIRQVSSQLADFLRLGPTPASPDEIGCSAVNRNVGGSNPPRGANSLSIQRVANIFRKLCPLAMKCQVHESRLISINQDEGKSTRAGVSEVDQINRGQSRSNQAFGSQPNACQLACRYGDAPASQLEVSQTTQYKRVSRYRSDCQR